MQSPESESGDYNINSVLLTYVLTTAYIYVTESRKMVPNYT